MSQRPRFTPGGEVDFGVDGGAFPDVHVDQYPLGVGIIGEKVPITFLSGFLGSGKTTTLKHILENKQGRKVGVVVNDVAEVNIDAKLIRARTAEMEQQDRGHDMSDTVELDNGCACCTARADLMDSILKLIRLSIRRDIRYDRIVVEMSGVSEPKNLRLDFLDNEETHQVFLYVQLQTMVTVVDSFDFFSLYSSKSTIKEMPALVVKEGQALGQAKKKEGDQEEGGGGNQAGSREKVEGVCGEETQVKEEEEEEEEHTEMTRRVVELLVEMMEVADVVLLNKTDRLTSESAQVLDQMARELNPTAVVQQCSFGQVSLDLLLSAPAGGKWACRADEDDEVRAAVAARRVGKRKLDIAGGGGFFTASGGGKKMFKAGGEEEGPGAKSMASDKLAAKQQTSAAKRFGISSFVYTRRRPFNPFRLMTVLGMLPVKVNADGKVTDTWSLAPRLLHGELDTVEEESRGAGEGAGDVLVKNCMHSVIRSKGFAWIANHPRMLHYWSHAGHFFSLDPMGKWWASVPLEEWPSSQQEILRILEEFDPPPGSWGGNGGIHGDRRQEIVFIGMGLNQDEIEMLLDECLLNEEEMVIYNAKAPPQLVAVTWPPPLPGDGLVAAARNPIVRSV